MHLLPREVPVTPLQVRYSLLTDRGSWTNSSSHKLEFLLNEDSPEVQSSIMQKRRYDSIGSFPPPLTCDPGSAIQCAT